MAGTIENVPDPVTYTVIASANGVDSSAIDQLTVYGVEAGVDFVLTAADADDGGGVRPPVRDGARTTKAARKISKSSLGVVPLVRLYSFSSQHFCYPSISPSTCSHFTSSSVSSRTSSLT